MGKKGLSKGIIMNIKKLIPCLLALAAVPALAAASTATPKRIGPVSYYGALHTDGGKIVGAKNGQEAMIRGMSLFWSDATGMPYYNKNVITWAAENLPMDVFRFAMGITYYDSDGGTSNALDEAYSYNGAPDGYMGIIDQMVEAAIENDIYIIIDWHSHRATNEQNIAKTFFEQVAKKYKDVPNVIYEIFNEPVSQSWDQVKGYANNIVPLIRNSTDNLVLVGTPSWSQMTQYGGVNGKNVGYVLHFYAGTHGVGTYGGRATQAKSSGNAVFITEWGTTNADGAGSPSSGSTQEWMSFMETNKISNCNWSLRAVGSKYAVNNKQETSAMFSGSDDLNTIGKLNSASYSESGKLVKDYLSKHATDWPSLFAKSLKTGSCSFNATTVKESAGNVASVLKSGCTYTSSNENVVTSTGDIKSAGYVIMTGNDGSQSLVIVSAEAKQTIAGFVDLKCYNNGDCTNNRTQKYSGGQNMEWVVSVANTTDEGAKFTLTSLDPSVVTVKTATCSDASCSSLQKGKQVVMYEFKGYGTAKVVATAPAAAGFPALQDTVEVSYLKTANRIHSNFGKGADKQGFVYLAPGETKAKFFPDTALSEKAKVTYTFNGKESSSYLTKNGNDLVAGSQNAIVIVTGHADETANYGEVTRSTTVIIGDLASAVNAEEYYAALQKMNGEEQGIGVFKTKPTLPLRATIANAQLLVNSKESGDIHVDVFSIMGQKVVSKVISNNSTVSLGNIPTGAYLITVRQGVKQLNIRWTKK